MRYNAFAREKAIDALESSDIVDDDGLLRDIVDTVLAAYSAALPIEPTQAPEPPEGKLRVRVCVALMEDGKVHSCPVTDKIADAQRDFRLECAPDVPQFRWIEADVTPWQPPAEETVQGREVAG